MPLIDDARSALFLSQAGDARLVRIDAVAIGLRGVGRLRQRVAQIRLPLGAAAIADVGLETVVIRLAQVHQHVDGPDATVDGQNRAGRIRRGPVLTWPGAVRSNGVGAFRSTVRSRLPQC